MRPDSLKSLFIKRGTMAAVCRATGLKMCTVSNWVYVPDRHLKAVSDVTGVAQKHLPRKPVPLTGG